MIDSTPASFAYLTVVLFLLLGALVTDKENKRDKDFFASASFGIYIFVMLWAFYAILWGWMTK